MTRHLTFFVFYIVLFISLPTPTNASFAVGDTHAVFTIPFEFVTAKEPYRIPVIAEKRADANAVDRLGYTLRSDTASDIGTYRFAGIVVGDLPIEDGMYVLPANSRAQFTFVGFLRVRDTLPEQNIALQLTHLPYLRGEDMNERFASEFTLNALRSGSVTLGN